MEKKLEKFKIDYDNTVKYIFHLSDIRFKLLGLLPIATGIAFSFTNPESSPVNSLILGTLGLMVTLGILFYDQRNSQIYDGLMSRAKEIEKKMELEKIKPNEQFGGTFRNRPKRGRKLFGAILMWHDRGLAIIYSTVIWVWLFIIITSSISILGINKEGFNRGLIGLSIVISLILYYNLINLDKKSGEINNNE